MFGRFSSRAALSALLAALIVVGGYLVLQLFNTLMSAFIMIAQGNGQSSLPMLVPLYLRGFAVGVLPFAIGVFLSLWIVAPIQGTDRLTRVIGGSLLAVAVGAAAIFVVTFFRAAIDRFDQSAGLVNGWVTGFTSGLGSAVDGALAYSLYNAVSLASSLVPLTVLAGVLVWVWARAHPMESAASELAGEARLS